MSTEEPLLENDIFERVGPRLDPGGAEPGDRYRAWNPWKESTTVLAVGKARGQFSLGAWLRELRDPRKWIQVACGLPPFRGRTAAEWPDDQPPMFAGAGAIRTKVMSG